MPQPSKHQFEPLSYKVIGACIDVQKQLGLHCMEDAEQCLLYVTKANQKRVFLVNTGEKPLRPRRFVNTPTENAKGKASNV